MSRTRKKSWLPFLFLASLAVLAAFAAGVRHGSLVASRNKEPENPGLPKPTILPTTAKIPETIVSFSIQELSACGLQLPVPDVLQKDKLSSHSAIFRTDTQILSLSCDRENYLTLLDTASSATISATIFERPVQASEGAFLQSSKGSVVLLTVPAPRGNSMVQIVVSPNLLPLLELGLRRL